MKSRTTLFVSSKLPTTKADGGQAAEYFTAADLLSRGLAVTKPLNVNGEHDLHAKVNGRWLTFQVKTALMSHSGKLRPNCRGRKTITSDVIAHVFLPTKQIRYEANGLESLPVELGEKLSREK
jgi:hypothetical protein